MQSPGGSLVQPSSTNRLKMHSGNPKDAENAIIPQKAKTGAVRIEEDMQRGWSLVSHTDHRTVNFSRTRVLIVRLRENEELISTKTQTN